MKKTIYTVATAHLDTIWNWSFETTLSRYLPATMERNFTLLARYPDYRFNFEGAYRYELMQTYYPEAFETLRGYVRQGRWNVCGSAYENGDVNIPSPEALLRNILYGNAYFERTFGVRSTDVFLPDCFGFGWALPSIMAHCGLRGFTTQKLSWGSAYGVPFDVGRWVGVNGDSVYACVNMGNYTSSFSKIRALPFIKKKLEENVRRGLPLTAAFHGVGDRGGAPKESSVCTLQKEIDRNPQSEIEVRSAAADALFCDLDRPGNAALRDALPVWNNELVMTDHGAGCYTSRAISKRWNAKCESLGFLAEEMAAIAALFGRLPYDKRTLTGAWKRVIAHQFHDDLTGTALQAEYRRSWNDYMLSMNQFADCYASAGAAVIGCMDTSFCSGTPVAVHNPHLRTRTAVISVPWAAAGAVRVFDDQGQEVPSQQYRDETGTWTLAFSASVPSCGLRVFDVQNSGTVYDGGAVCEASDTVLENDRVRVHFNDNGEIDSLYSKDLARELLAAPIRFDVLRDNASFIYPAWELRYHEVMAAPKGHPAVQWVKPLYAGACCAAVQIASCFEKTAILTTVRLCAGSDRVELQTELDWHCHASLLKLRFPLAAQNARARYDLGLGYIERETNSKKLYEVPAQRWAALLDSGGSFGVGVISDSKRGWDKPDLNTLRLTVLHTPANQFRPDSMQGQMDLGLNRFGVALVPLGSADTAPLDAAAEEFCVPMQAFVTDRHTGTGEVPPAFSFLQCDCDGVTLRAVKESETGFHPVLRIGSLRKEAQTVTLRVPFKLKRVRDCTGCETPTADLPFENNAVSLELRGFDLRTLRLDTSDGDTLDRGYAVANLPYNVRVFSSHCAPGCGAVPGKPYALPFEEFPDCFASGGCNFFAWNAVDARMRTLHENNALLCDGQVLAVPERAKYFTFVGASLGEDKMFKFLLDGAAVSLTVQSMEERVGGWDLVELNEAAFRKPDPVALVFSHTRHADGDNYGDQKYFFRYRIPVSGTHALTLPKQSELLMLAASFLFETDETALLTDPIGQVPARQVRKEDYQPAPNEARIRKLISLWRKAF
ncbi:MAG: hypothetical protein IKN72_03305 [Clostridia bacterium]|nr:hypothetical protein [Clostridia bacterium]